MMNIEEQIDILTKTRENLLKVLNSFSLEQIVQIPVGFNNNILWNVAHCVASQQALNYRLSGNEINIDPYWVENFKKGTNAKELKGFDESRLKELKKILIDTPKILLEDYKKGIFNNFNSYETSYGVTITNIDKCITFSNLHEGLHLGYIMAQVKLLK